MATSVDVLIVTALKLELDALKEVEAGRLEAWRKVSGETPYWTTRFEGASGPLRVAAARLTEMGGVATALVAERLGTLLEPRCLAMSGVCAGRPGDTERGDVIIADRVFQHDSGKQKSSGFQGDLWPATAARRWRYVAQELEGPAKNFVGYVEAGEEDARWWLLDKLLSEGGTVHDPLASVAFRRYIPDALRERTLTQLEDERQEIVLVGGGYALTETGRKAIQRHRVRKGVLVQACPYHIHVGPIGSGNAVEADGEVWAKIAGSGMRKILGVEMEAATIGAVAQERGVPFAVAKGVMDHADPKKSDRYKAFAARSSAEVLMGFLARVLEPAEAARRSEPTMLRSRAPRESAGGERAGQERDTSAGDDPPPESWVEALTKLLDANPALCARLGRVHPEWEALAQTGAEPLARAILATDSTVLSTACVAAMRDRMPPVAQVEAESLRDLFEFALPCVVKAGLLWEEEGRLKTRVRKPQTLEPLMASLRASSDVVPQLEWRSPGREREHPKPRYYVAVSETEIPEGGADWRERSNTIKADIDVRHRRVVAAGMEWFEHEPGADDFLREAATMDREGVTSDESIKELGSHLSKNVEAVSAGRRGLYGLVRKPSDAERRIFDQLQQDIEALRVVEAWPTTDNLDEDFHLHAYILVLYNLFRASGVNVYGRHSSSETH